MPRRFHFKGYTYLLSISITLSCALSGSANEDEKKAGAGQREIGLGDLIAHGLKNDPKLIALRGEITIATARKKAARDWPDPQIRFRKSWDDTDPFASEVDLVARFRLYVPHPGIRRARLNRAQHEIQLARAELVSEDRRVVQRIREEYEELQYLKTRIELQEKNDEAAKIYSDAQDKLLTNGLTTIDKIEYVEIDNLASDGIAIDYEAARDRLAARVGLQNSSAIRITDKLISPAVDLDHSHLEYLIRMALANRGELTTHSEKGGIAQAQLNEAKARNRPWFDYFQAEFGREEQGGIKSGTDWGIQFAMSLPIFSWLGNERKIHEAAVKSHYSQMGAIQRIVTAEIAAAYQNVKRCADYRSKAREHARERKERNAGFFEKIGGMDRRKLEETRYDVTRGTLNADRHRLDAEHAYTLSLLQLEQALGTSLSRVFSGKDASQPEQAANSASVAVAKAAPGTKAPEVTRAVDSGNPSAGDKEASKVKRSSIRSKVRVLLDKISLPGKARKSRQP
jgi:outer membrane protein TolC